VLGVNDVRQREIHTAEAQVPKPGAFEVEVAIVKPERHKSPGIDQIPAELIKAGDRTIHSEIINLLILFGIMNCQASRKIQSLYLFIRSAIKRCSNYRGI
jgi:hypothetical protein